MVEQADDSQKKLVFLQTFSLHLICPINFIYPTSPICSFFPPIPLLHPFHTSLLTYLIYSLYPAVHLSLFHSFLHSIPTLPFIWSIHFIPLVHPTCSSHLFLPSHHICPCHHTFSCHLMHSLNPPNVSIDTKGFPSFNSAAMSLNQKGRGKEIQRVVKH